MPQFDVSSFSSQLFWLVVVFGFLYVIVSKVIAPKAETILASRNRYVEENISVSRECEEMISALKEQKSLKLKELNLEIESLLSTSIASVDEIFTKKEQILSTDLSKMIADSAVEIQNYAQSFHLDESLCCVDLSSLIIEKITGKPADLKLLKKIHEAK